MSKKFYLTDSVYIDEAVCKIVNITGKEKKISKLRWKLLKILLDNYGNIVDYPTLLNYVHGEEVVVEKYRSCDDIQRLVNQIKSALFYPIGINKDDAEKIIETVSGHGYIINVTRIEEQLVERYAAATPIGAKLPASLDNSHFICRDDLIDRIDRRMKDNSTAVFLCGIGGIGKTSLAIRYSELHTEYKYFFLHFSRSLKKTIASLCFSPAERDLNEDERFAKNIQHLYELDNNIVLIIDNADTDYNLREDPVYCEHFHNVPIKFIITTRNAMSGSDAVEVLPLSEDDCLQLMRKYYSRGSDKKLLEIIREVDRHTLTCELLAKMLAKTPRLDAAQVVDSLRHSAIADEHWRKVQTFYHDGFVDRSVLEHLCAAFNLSNLSANEKRVLGAFCFSETGFTDEYVDWLFSDQDWDIIVNLCERGWINERMQQIIETRIVRVPENPNPVTRANTYDRRTFSLHPIVRTICLLDESVRPTWKINGNFIREYVIRFYNDEWIDFHWDKTSSKHIQTLFSFTEMPDFDNIEKEDPDCSVVLFLSLSDLDLSDNPSIAQKIKGIFSLTSPGSPLYYIALEKFGFTSNDPLKKFELSRAQRYWKLDPDTLSDFVRRFIEICFFEYPPKFAGLREKIQDPLQESKGYLLLGDHENEKSCLSRSFFFEKIQELKDAGKKDTEIFEILEINSVSKEYLFSRWRYPISIHLCGMSDKSLELISFFIRYIEKTSPYSDSWISCLLQENLHAMIPKHDDLLALIRLVNDSLHNIVLHSPMEKHAELIKKRIHAFEILSSLCEIGYLIADESKNTDKAEHYRKKYYYYTFLYSFMYSVQNNPHRPFLNWLDYLNYHPFTPPMIDGKFFDEDWLPQAFLSDTNWHPLDLPSGLFEC